MSSILSSPGVVLATAMAVSGVILLALRREKNFPPTQFPGESRFPPHRANSSLLSLFRYLGLLHHFCISIYCVKLTVISCVDGKKRERKKKKRVQFAESVKDQSGNGEEYRKEHKKSTNPRSCRGQIREMPANRVALYSGVLRDRVQRSECSY
ncbi:hypothetical protein Acr_11g0013480 [Actinidia rufa]|uniref:Uncharacterized protein n=1 Tax=Actinidia rufa TaxID=165716 RepID=A0A7J0FE58_9ERIC|nr:hypothetical protein Acr_11g0012710 [Actinidia rufa]GFY97042.1 hypothetical protein Acr_11g0013480 [Actinidia rufa]